jgi:hypothetical protein
MGYDDSGYPYVHHCEHDLRHCPKCNTVYCAICGQEWKAVHTVDLYMGNGDDIRGPGNGACPYACLWYAIHRDMSC